MVSIRWILKMYNFAMKNDNFAKILKSMANNQFVDEDLLYD